MKRSSLLLLLLLDFYLAGSGLRGRASEPMVREESSHQAMGTIFTIIAYGSPAAQVAGAVNRAFQEIDRLDGEMSNYQPRSELSKLNREAYRRAVVLSPELFRLLQVSMRYSEKSGGDFDITVGPLMKAWGFFRGWGRLPSLSELARVRARIGYQHVHLDPAKRTVRFDEPGMEIDLGAIAKGYAVDRVAETLRKAGITRALISSGSSSIGALGSPPGEPGWQISLRHPLDPGKTAGLLRLQNMSLSVSGEYEKSFEIGGKVYSHLLDPHTAMPVQNMLMTVVISPSGTDSDALSTSLFVGGPKSARNYLDRHRNLTAIFYLPGGSGAAFREIVLNSRVMKLPAGSFVKFSGRSISR